MQPECGVCMCLGGVASVVVLGMVGNRVDGEEQSNKGRGSDVIRGSLFDGDDLH